jgi:DNA-binding MarR family transcriptional regulator
VAALDDFSSTIRETAVIQRVNAGMMMEAAQALRDICQQFERTGAPLADHHLPAGGYMGEMIVKALIEAGHIEEVFSDERGFLHQYKPTKEGQSLFTKLMKEDIFARKVS